jgi:tRNA wybutosine-synthesizing protein 1
MTPAAFYCTQQCLFCWRAQKGDLHASWDEQRLPRWDDPEQIVEGCLKAQHAILSGYKDNWKTDVNKLKEAEAPRHVAISLTGEPTLYSRIRELIHIFHRKGFTTFLVSNGTIPSSLAKLDEEPTQLYISVCAPDRKTFRQVCRPQISKAWERLNETLELLPSFRCPTVMRITSVRGLNMKGTDGYAGLVNKAQPAHIEVKAYMHVGFSRLRLGYENTPSHDEIREFSAQLASQTSYNVIDESTESRVALLSKHKHPKRFGEN